MRNGQVVHVILYGGRGGGKHQKGSDVELGHLCRGIVSGRAQSEGLIRGKDFEAVWSHQNIRHDYKLYSLLCFFLEVIAKLAPQASWEEEIPNEFESGEMAGFFRVLSNALVYLDTPRGEAAANLADQLALFVSKLMLELGIFPLLERCVLSGTVLTSQTSMGLLSEKGGFADSKLIAVGRSGLSHTPLRQFLIQVRETRYPDFVFSGPLEHALVKNLVDYFLFHVHLHPFDFKTLSLVI